MSHSSRLKWRRALVAALLLAGIAQLNAVQAQGFPARPVHLIVPYAPGAGADLLARVAAAKLGENLKQTVIVEPKPGGDTMIGTRAALMAAPDGYTILLATTTTAIAPLVYKEPGYSFDSLEVIMPLSFDGFMLSVNAQVPAKNLAEFVAHVKANQGKLNQGSLGSAGPIALITDRFRAEAGLSMEKINYSGSGPALKDLAGGTIQMIVAGPVGTMPLVKSGHIRALAYTAGERNPLAPDVPTFKELGWPNIVGGVWYGLVVNARMADGIKQRFAREGASVRATADFKDKLMAQGSTPWPGSLQDFTSFVRSDMNLWIADIKRSNITPN